MIKIDNDNCLYADVDDTIVSWALYPEASPDAIEFVAPHSGHSFWLKVNQATVESIKIHKSRGNGVIVWSQGGACWAETVVKTLGLEDYVDAVLSKPKFLYDDKHPNVWMPTPKLPGGGEIANVI